jgi:hypothetical protein
MNEYDRNNLRYLMSLSKEEFTVFCGRVSEDDREYAAELLRIYRAELTLEQIEKFDYVESVADAKKLLDKFTIRG